MLEAIGLTQPFCLRLPRLEAERHCDCVVLRSGVLGICFYTARLGARTAAKERLVSLGTRAGTAGRAFGIAQVAG